MVAARLDNQALRELGINAPVPCFVRIGQRRAFDLTPEAHVVKLGGLCRQTDLGVAQTLAAGQLSEAPPELFGTGKRFGVVIAAMSIDKAGEGPLQQKIHQLSEQRLAGVHERLRVWLPRNFFGSSF